MSAATRIGNALVGMWVLSDVPAQKLGTLRGGGDPGDAMLKQMSEREVTLYEDWLGRLERLATAMEQELDLARSGALTRARQRDGLENRIKKIHNGKGHVHVAFIEGVSESYVRKVRRGHDTEGSG